MSKYIMEVKEKFPESRVTWEVVTILNRYLIITAKPVSKEKYEGNDLFSNLNWHYSYALERVTYSILLK